MSEIIGRIRPNFRGTYSSGTEYINYDSCMYGGKSWLYLDPTKTTPTTGTAPSEATGWVVLTKNMHLDTQGLSWRDVQTLVQQGFGKQAFPVGSQFLVTKGAGTVLYDVVHHGDQLDGAGVALPYGMVLMAHYGLNGVVFSAAQANYKILTQIAINATKAITFGATSYQFTASKNLVFGGKLKYKDPTHFNYYATAVATAEEMTMQAGEPDGTYTVLGSAINAQNHADRVTSGSNAYIKSAARELVLSSLAKGTFFTGALDDYALAPLWHSTGAGGIDGWQYQMDEAFLAVCQPTTREVELNTITDGGGNATFSDKFFLPSRKEIYGSRENVTHNGTHFQLYAPNIALADGADPIKAKYDSVDKVTLRNWWLRSSHSDVSYIYRSVDISGGFANNTALTTSYAIAPCCVIY